MTPAKDAGSADHVGDGHGGLWDGRSDWRGAGEAMGTEEPHAALHPATKKIGIPMVYIQARCLLAGSVVIR